MWAGMVQPIVILLQANAWVYWQAIENNDTPTWWGLIQACLPLSQPTFTLRVRIRVTLDTLPSGCRSVWNRLIAWMEYLRMPSNYNIWASAEDGPCALFGAGGSGGSISARINLQSWLWIGYF
jgi:hypothetical protein